MTGYKEEKGFPPGKCFQQFRFRHICTRWIRKCFLPNQLSSVVTCCGDAYGLLDRLLNVHRHSPVISAVYYDMKYLQTIPIIILIAKEFLMIAESIEHHKEFITSFLYLLCYGQLSHGIILLILWMVFGLLCPQSQPPSPGSVGSTL